MPKKALGSLGALVKKNRGLRGLREVAHEIGIGAATLLRIENGHVPDIATFGKVCKWLNEDPRDFLGLSETAATGATGHLIVSAHFRAGRVIKQDTVNALAQMIMLAANMQPKPEKTGA